MKICEKCGDEIGGRDGDNRCPKCDNAATGARKGARRNRRMVAEVMRDLGLVKVRGAMGGVYYE